MTHIDRSTENLEPFEGDIELLAHLHSLPDWATDLVEVRDIPDDPLQNGSIFRHKNMLEGRS